VSIIPELHIGVDVSLRSHSVAFVRSDDLAVLHRMTVQNDAGGSLALAEQIQHLCAQHAFDQVKVALEATGVYAWHLAVFLSGLDVPHPHKPQVFILQPRAVKHYRESFGSKKPKSDGADRLLLARMLGHRELLPRPFALDDRTLPLQRLTRHRYHLVRQLVRNKNYAASYLFLKASTLAQTRPLSDPFGASASEILLEYCAVEDIAKASVDELAGVLNRAARGTIADPAAIALAYKRAAEDAYRLPERLKQPIHEILTPFPHISDAISPPT
jgi:transposase